MRKRSPSWEEVHEGLEDLLPDLRFSAGPAELYHRERVIELAREIANQ